MKTGAILALIIISIPSTNVMTNRLSLTQQTTGSWGGQHIAIELSESGGQVEFDCAHGQIEGKIELDSKGQFKAPGTYVEEHGGPARESESGSGIRVIYSGQVKGDLMKLSIRRRDNNRLIGSFSLVKGGEPEIVKCR